MTAAPALLPSLHALVEKWRELAAESAWHPYYRTTWTNCADELEALLSRAVTTQADPWKIELVPVVVRDVSDAHYVRLSIGCQHFNIGPDYLDTRADAQWFATQLDTALRKAIPPSQPVAPAAEKSITFAEEIELAGARGICNSTVVAPVVPDDSDFGMLNTLCRHAFEIEDGYGDPDSNPRNFLVFRDGFFAAYSVFAAALKMSCAEIEADLAKKAAAPHPAQPQPSSGQPAMSKSMAKRIAAQRAEPFDEFAKLVTELERDHPEEMERASEWVRQKFYSQEPTAADELRAMIYAPRDGTKIELFIRHHSYYAAQRTGDTTTRWEGFCIGHWTDHNGGGWTWSGHAGTPEGWREIARERKA